MRAIRLLDRFLRASLRRKVAGINAVGFSGIGVEFNGALKLLFRLRPISNCNYYAYPSAMWASASVPSSSRAFTAASSARRLASGGGSAPTTTDPREL